jgi:L-asparaginase
MAHAAPLPFSARPIHVLAMGGTIAMEGEHARPALDAEALLAAVPGLQGHAGLTAETVASLPGPQVRLEDALDLGRRAAQAASRGYGVVVTHGTDTLEESAFLADLMYAGDAPIVFTGAIRPASAPGADGAANLLDAVAVAGSVEASGLGAVVVFAGEIHAARTVRKSDSTSPRCFSSPGAGPIGGVAEGRVRVWSRPVRGRPVAPSQLNAWVPIVSAALGEDARAATAALAAGADGLVVVAFGAGHLPPPLFSELARAAANLPVVVTCRPHRASILQATYGFEGSERDLRASPMIPAGLLSPAAARMKLVACLGAGLSLEEIREAFVLDDG